MTVIRGMLKRIAIVLAGALLVVGSSSARGGAICGYQVTHLFRAPFCNFTGQYPFIYALAISPNERYVCGFYSPCNIGSDRAYVFDTQTNQFINVPLPPGILQSKAYDVNESGMVVGAWGGSAGDFGYVDYVQTGQYTNLPPINAGGTCGAYAINNAGVVNIDDLNLVITT